MSDLTGYDALAPEEIVELHENPELIHLYDAHRIVSLLLTPAEPGLLREALLDAFTLIPADRLALLRPETRTTIAALSESGKGETE